MSEHRIFLPDILEELEGYWQGTLFPPEQFLVKLEIQLDSKIGYCVIRHEVHEPGGALVALGFGPLGEISKIGDGLTVARIMAPVLQARNHLEPFV